MRDASLFRERFKRWKNGELVYDGGRPVELPRYTKGKDDEPIDAGLLPTVDVIGYTNPEDRLNAEVRNAYNALDRAKVEEANRQFATDAFRRNEEKRKRLEIQRKNDKMFSMAIASMIGAPMLATAPLVAPAIGKIIAEVGTPGSSFWLNPVTKGMATGLLTSTAVDTASKALTDRTWGENMNEAIYKATGWNPQESAWTSWIPDATNPGWFTNPTRVLNTTDNIVLGTKKGINFLNSPITGKWTQFGKNEYRFKPGYLGMNSTPIESKPIRITADNAAAITDAELDAAYKAAVESGNRTEALKLLEQAYLNSGILKSEITMTPEGNALGWFHGSEWGNHTIFDSSAMNATIGGASAAGKVKGNFLTTDFPSAARYAGTGRWQSMADPKTTIPTTFWEKMQNLFGRYKPRTLYPAERVGEFGPKPGRLFDTKGQSPISHISKVDKVVYPMYVNPGENPMIIDFQGNPWSKSPIKFPNDFSVRTETAIKDPHLFRGEIIPYTLKEEVVPFKTKDEAINYYLSLQNSHGTQWVENPENLANKYFPESGGSREVQMFTGRPLYNRAHLIETHVPKTTNGAVQTAAREGNTSVLIKNVIDSNGGPNGVHYAIDDFVTLKPEQMKLADITYDDAGNLIPLSQRFQWGEKDIRYGLIPWILGGGTAATLYNNLDGYKNGKDSIRIKPNKRGTFTKAAKSHGMSVQAFAARVLANKDNYSTAMVKKANFARNASRWHKR